MNKNLVPGNPVYIHNPTKPLGGTSQANTLRMEAVSQTTPLNKKAVTNYMHTPQKKLLELKAVSFPREIWELIMNYCGTQTLAICRLVSTSMAGIVDNIESFKKARSCAKIIAEDSQAAVLDTFICSVMGVLNVREMRKAGQVITFDTDLKPQELLETQSDISSAARSLHLKANFLKSALKTYCCVLTIPGLIIFLMFGLYYNWDHTHLKIGAAIIFPTFALLGLFCDCLPLYIRIREQPSIVEV